MKKFPSSQNPPNASADAQANKHPKHNHHLPKNLDQKAQKKPTNPDWKDLKPKRKTNDPRA